MSARRSLALALASTASALILTTSASADGGPVCSVTRQDPRTAVEGASVALVGTMTSYRSAGAVATGSITVDRVLEGEVAGTEIEVVVDRRCPPAVTLGELQGFLLRRDGSRWAVEPDGAMPAAVMERAAKPLPAPRGGTAVLLARVGTPSAPVVALDAAGEVVAYAPAGAVPEVIAACPTGRRAVGVSQTGVTVWALPSMEVVDRYDARAKGPLASARCDTVDGTGALGVPVSDADAPRRRAKVGRVTYELRIPAVAKSRFGPAVDLVRIDGAGAARVLRPGLLDSPFTDQLVAIDTGGAAVVDTLSAVGLTAMTGLAPGDQDTTVAREVARTTPADDASDDGPGPVLVMAVALQALVMAAAARSLLAPDPPA